ncbi:hypothetical protein ABT369_38640 [Dactylosporangium sp. NPDC000244]|uniref:hypothetical protein n=1 Tax=Dactylosporangium sp. NPDC000244 TaxID=3154365 RepID=UPI003318D9CC
MSTQPVVPSAVALWLEAGGGTRGFDRDRYRQLLRDRGLLVPGEPEALPCGWTPGGLRGEFAGPSVTEAPEHRAARQRTREEDAAAEGAKYCRANRGRREAVSRG